MVIGTAVGRSIAPRSSSATAPLSSPVGAAGGIACQYFDHLCTSRLKTGLGGGAVLCCSGAWRRRRGRMASFPTVRTLFLRRGGGSVASDVLYRESRTFNPTEAVLSNTMSNRTIRDLDPSQSKLARDLLEHVVATAGKIAKGDERSYRRILKFLVNRLKVRLDGRSAPEKVKLAQELRARQNGICLACGLPLPSDPDEVEKHRVNRGVGYDDARIELRHRKCHRAEHAAADWA